MKPKTNDVPKRDQGEYVRRRSPLPPNATISAMAGVTPIRRTANTLAVLGSALPGTVPTKPPTVSASLPRVGRSTEYKPEYCDVVIALMSEGASLYECCLDLFVSMNTVYDWVERFPDFSLAVEMGKTLQQGWWNRLGRANTMNPTFNNGLYVYMTANMFKWRRNDPIEVKGRVDVNETKTLNANINLTERKLDLKMLKGFKNDELELLERLGNALVTRAANGNPQAGGAGKVLPLAA